jgi:hypothetical protein
MADLSPEALNVWCRFCEVVEDHGPPRLGLAAALRAAADQLTPYSVEDMLGAAFCRNKILAIAAELEGQ